MQGGTLALLKIDRRLVHHFHSIELIYLTNARSGIAHAVRTNYELGHIERILGTISVLLRINCYAAILILKLLYYFQAFTSHATAQLSTTESVLQPFLRSKI
jgi:hypothetical protein